MGYGPLVRASAGLSAQWRYPDDPNSFSDGLTVYPDHAAGRIAAIGVVALLVRRLRTGRGGEVCMSQAEIMMSHMAVPAAKLALETAGHQVTGDDLEAHSDVYRCEGDDEWCVVTIRDDLDSQTIARVTGDIPVAEWLKSRSPQEAMEVLQAAGVPAAAMLRVSQLPEFGYYRDRNLFRVSSHPHLPKPYIEEGRPVPCERLPDPPDDPAPLLGEHSIEIARRILKLSDEEIDRLCSSGALELYKTAKGRGT